MVTEHHQPARTRFTPPPHDSDSSPSHDRTVRVTGERLITLCAWLLFAQLGCQSVVDPGRSWNATRPPQGAVIMPPAPQPVGPSATTSPTVGVARQPAASVLQLPQAKPGESKYHTVVNGDNWSSIAKAYQLTVQELTDANGMDQATKLQPGQLVYIPEK